VVRRRDHERNGLAHKTDAAVRQTRAKGHFYGSTFDAFEKRQDWRCLPASGNQIGPSHDIEHPGHCSRLHGVDGQDFCMGPIGPQEVCRRMAVKPMIISVATLARDEPKVLSTALELMLRQFRPPVRMRQRQDPTGSGGPKNTSTLAVLWNQRRDPFCRFIKKFFDDPLCGAPTASVWASTHCDQVFIFFSRYGSYSIAVCTENLIPNIVVMQTTQDWACSDKPGSLDRARGWRVLVE